MAEESLSLQIYQQKPLKLKSKKKKQRLKKKKNRTEYPRTVGQLQKVQHLCDENTGRNGRSIRNNNNLESLKLNAKHQNTDLGSSENSTQDSFPGGSDGKESGCNAGDPALIPGSERYPGEGNGNPL